ncbi:hypothetical protein AVEN_163308-1 [Araneus ventricosus]|uniref:Uncharacterized protein n=1 Tax=Araneus ventricosus TaxID=182803 RepID=A0A4Y2N5D6_ARAVE|nr:hypothetical protein AVEN_163308-1 [Araneus ventricosus]
MSSAKIQYSTPTSRVSEKSEGKHTKRIGYNTALRQTFLNRFSPRERVSPTNLKGPILQKVVQDLCNITSNSKLKTLKDKTIDVCSIICTFNIQTYSDEVFLMAMGFRNGSVNFVNCKLIVPEGKKAIHRRRYFFLG